MQQKSWYYPNKMSYNTSPEYFVVQYLNKHLLDIYSTNNNDGVGLICKRSNEIIEKDIDVFIFDFQTNEILEKLCVVEVETKPNEKFNSYPSPPPKWTDWSFLARKINRGDFKDEDIYVLCNNKSVKYDLMY